MKLFPNTRARRNTAFMVLLVWLFALTSGVANACLLQAPEARTHIIATAGYPALADATAIPPGHAGDPADHHDDSHSFNAPCLKVCDDGSRSVPQHDVTPVQPDPGPAPLVLILWTADAPLVAALGNSGDLLLPTQWLPLRVRFSRLAL
ncbi:hypothetical protein BH10PSE16_BH10PSE16_35730 [soil metagenome]